MNEVSTETLSCRLCGGSENVRTRYDGPLLCIECWRKERDEKRASRAAEVARLWAPENERRRANEMARRAARAANVRVWQASGCLGCRFAEFDLEGCYNAVVMYVDDDPEDFPDTPNRIVGECHHHAPLVTKKHGETETHWPTVLASDQCGDREAGDEMILSGFDYLDGGEGHE